MRASAGQWKPPVWLIFIGPFVTLLIGTVGIAGYCSWRTEQEIIHNTVTQLQQEISNRLQEKLENYLEAPYVLSQINSTAVKLKQLDLKNTSILTRQFWHQRHLLTDANISAIYFGNPQGEFVIMRFQSDRTWRIGRVNQSTIGKYHGYTIDSEGNPAQLVEIRNAYDPRVRPWYTAALQAKKPIWTPIYLDFQGMSLTKTLAMPLYNSSGQLLGVIGVDYNLSEISKFLQLQKIARTGKSFIIKRSGQLVASSTALDSFVHTQGKAQEPLLAVNSQVPLIQSTTEYLNKQTPNLADVNSSRSLIANIDGQKLFLQIVPVQNSLGIDWLIVVIVPESDFTAQIVTIQRTTRVFYLLAVSGAIVLGIIITNSITKPICRLAQASEAVANGKLNENVPAFRIRELDALSCGFNRMASQLQQSFAELEYANQVLEQRVEERTADLRQSEEKFSKAFRLSPHPISISRLSDRRFLEVNDACLERMGYSRDEMLGKSGLELNIWADPNDAERTGQLLLEHSSFHNLEINYRRKSGEIVTVLQSAEVIEFNGQTCVITISNDITERKQAENALKQAKEQAEKANRIKSQFLANMSHELRTPLNAILGFSILLARDPSLNQKQQANLKIINDSGEHLLNLINDVLDMSKIEAGHTTLNSTSFDLYHLLDSLDELFRLKANTKGIHLQFDRSPNLPRYIHTDESKLRQVLINLLSNAIKFTQAGHVILRVNGFPKTPAIIYFEVEDTGCGIAANDRSRIFEAFVQTGSGDYSGTGLGLPISRRFVQLMGGELTLSSALGHGSTFRFHIQVTIVDTIKHKEQSIYQSVIGLAPSQPKYRIMVAEDRWESRQFLTQLLEEVGFEARGVENGQQAVSTWKEWEPHLIWMDMRMPIMDGYEATRQIKAHLKGQATVIIALTASALEEEKSLVLSAGCDDFVRKPFRESVIFEKLAQYLGVIYLYKEIQENVTKVQSLTEDLSPDTFKSQLAQMPDSWIARLHQAVSLADEDLIALLIEEIPESQSVMANTIRDLVNDFRYEQIMNITQQLIGSSTGTA